jgi:hypothetical protein
MWPESWAPRGAQPKSRAVHGRRSRLVKQATEELRRVGRSDRLPLFHDGLAAWACGRTASPCSVGGLIDRLGSWSNRQPLFRGRSDLLGSRSDCQPLFYGRSDRLGSWSDRQPLFRMRSAVKNPVERGAPEVVRAWEPL